MKQRKIVFLSDHNSAYLMGSLKKIKGEKIYVYNS